MNAVLQCLTHTPPLANAFLSERPLRRIERHDALRITQQLIYEALTQSGKRLAPKEHYLSLKKVCRRYETRCPYFSFLCCPFLFMGRALIVMYMNYCRPCESALMFVPPCASFWRLMDEGGAGLTQEHGALPST